MQPTTSRDFLRVSLHRLDAAEEINETLRRTLEAQYIGGYSVECSLKALIIETTPDADRPHLLEKLTRGKSSHSPDILRGLLKDRGIVLSLELARRMRQFRWNTNLRYETGRRDTGETNGLLRTARMIYDWAEGQIR